MSHADRLSNPLGGEFHPLSHHDSPDAVLRDVKLSAAEKRVILSSWASDMYAVDSNPALREVPGIPSPMRLSDILTALRRLDEGDDPPPRGAAAMRPVRWTSLDAIARPSHKDARTHSVRMTTSRACPSRWTREANVRRYRRLLATQLTDCERDYVEQRLAEELRAG
jgi:hypothetical protein